MQRPTISKLKAHLSRELEKRQQATVPPKKQPQKKTVKQPVRFHEEGWNGW